MATSNLREKFKLLRQWQMQQQEEFERMKMEHTLRFNHIENDGHKPVNNEALPTAYSMRSEEMIEEECDDGPSTEEYECREELPRNKSLLQRMSSNSLEKALYMAVNELKLRGQATEKSDQFDENSDCEDYEDGASVIDSFNGDKKFQASLLKGNKTCQNDELDSNGESMLEDVNELDGFYPIIYSEDNASQGDSDHQSSVAGEVGDFHDHHDYNEIKENTPFDEKPIQSKLGTDVISFEELVERQLEAEKKADVNGTADNNLAPLRGKNFLRKGQGIARYTTGFKTDQKLKKQSLKGKSIVSLPKTSLKLNMKPKRENENEEKMVASIVNQAIVDTNLMRKEMKSKNAIRKISNEDDSQSTHQGASVGKVDSSIEASFQNMIHNKDDEDKIADEELAEFELLEKVALDTSIASNASSVLRLVSSKKPNIAHHDTSSPIFKGFDCKPELGLKRTSSDVEEENDLFINSQDIESDIESLTNEEPFRVTGESDTLKKPKPNMISNQELNGLHERQTEFLDTSAWDDTIQSSDSLHNDVDDHYDDGNSTITEAPKKRERTNVQQHQSIEISPPTSKLMKKFFPKLDAKSQVTKPNQKKTNIKKAGDGNSNLSEDFSSPNRGNETVTSAAPSDVLKSKLIELESEISRFKNENSALEKRRFEKEIELKNLRNEVHQFQKQRAEELERIEKFREEEAQKLRREKKTFEKYQKAVRSAPSKKERDEIEALRQQLTELQDDVKRRETKWNGSASRFRKRIEDLENENYELKESIKLLEKERLERWAKGDQQKIVNGERTFNKNSPGVGLTQGQPNAKEFVDRGADFEEAVIPRKVKSNAGKFINPRGEVAVNKVEVIPRKDVIPFEQPETPRESSTNENTNQDLNPSLNVRLSLTPERQPSSVEKSSHNDAALKHQDGKIERILQDGSREITFPNGTRKTIDPTNQHIVVSFFNGDMKQIIPDGRTVYYYAESKTTHTTYKDGTEVFEFSNGQSEKHYADGRKVITFHDQTVKCIFANGAEETVFADGTIQNVDVSGQRTISFPNGQREIHTQNFKRREYPDGTVKTVYQDGRQETRYSTGRIRIKDQCGNIILDTGLS